MIGHPDCAIYTEDKLMQATLRTNSLFNNTISGKDSYMTYENPDKSKFRRTIHVPAYGCPSFLFNKELCFLMIEFACRSGINLSHYEIIFVDKDNLRTCVYTMTLDKLQQLIETGYKHGNKYVPLGEYPNTPKYNGNYTENTLVFTGNTHVLLNLRFILQKIDHSFHSLSAHDLYSSDSF